MGLTAKENGGSYQKAPVGSHVARCIRLIDIGTQRGEYQGKTTWKPQVIIAWELPYEIMEATEERDAAPFVVSKFYTLSLDEKANLRKHLSSWRGRDFTKNELKGFDLHNILNQPCMLSIIDKNDKSVVDAVMAITKGMQVPDRHNPIIAFDIESWQKGNAEMAVIFSGFSEKMQDLIKGSKECQEGPGEYTDEPPHPADDGGDIPF